MNTQGKGPNGTIPAITGQIDYSKAIHIFPDYLQPWRSTILAYGASFASTTMGYPLDTIKTRMQTHKNFTSYYDCIKKTYIKEGIVGFFRGIWAPLISTSFSKSLGVTIFTASKPFCYETLYSYTTIFDEVNPIIRNFPVCFLSGMLAGGGVSMFACPFEFTKIYSQLSQIIQNTALNKSKYSVTNNRTPIRASTINTIKQIVRYEGAMGLYSGYKYHLIRDSLSSGIYYSTYELLKLSMNEVVNLDPNKTSQISILMAGGFSGILCWSLIFPIDTTKSLIQKDVVTNILRKEQGLEPLPYRNRKIQKFDKRLYRGLGISCARTFIVNMVFFSVFEFTMAHIT